MLTNEQIAIITEELQFDPRVLAVLITGSYIYGIPSDRSDLDVRVVTSDPSHCGDKNGIRFGVRIELFVDTVDKIHFWMKQSIEEGHGACIHFWAHGKIAYDPQGIARQLQNDAKDLWKKGRADCLPWECRDEKYKKFIEPPF